MLYFPCVHAQYMRRENSSIDPKVSLGENASPGVQQQLFKPIGVWVNTQRDNPQNIFLDLRNSSKNKSQGM